MFGLLTSCFVYGQFSEATNLLGYILQDNRKYPATLTMVLKQTGGKLTGTAEISGVKTQPRSFSDNIGEATFEIEGNYNGSKKFEMEDVNVKSAGRGYGHLYKKRYYVSLIETADSIILSGTWDNAGNSEFKTTIDHYGVYNATPGKQACTPGSFHVSSAKPKCISGDCENGSGVQQIQLGKYTGPFKNGQRSGTGEFVYTSGRRKGAVYTGGFANNMFNGQGRLDLANTPSLIASEEGTFVDNLMNGQGVRIQKDGTIFSGNYQNGQLGGLLVCTNSSLSGKLPIIGYWLAENDTKGITMDVLKKHQDTAFARYVKSNCLDRKKFSIGSWAWTTEKYNEYNGLGDKIGESDHLTVNLSNPEFNGFVNNTTEDIYIRGYFEVYYSDRNVTEYKDGSYRLAPGEVAMGNYRLPPQPGAIYDVYFQSKFVFLGQYRDKTAPPCKPKPTDPNSVTLTILGGIETMDKPVKKGTKVTITAKGSISVGMFAGKTSPDGIEGYQSYSKVASFKHGALLCRIGDKGAWRLVGSSTSFTADSDGKLQFLVNDADDSNNTGQFQIEVKMK